LGDFPLGNLKISQFENLKMGSKPEGRLQGGNVSCSLGVRGSFPFLRNPDFAHGTKGLCQAGLMGYPANWRIR
jgi:hypothetical protein